MADNKDIADEAGQNAGTPPGISDPLSNRETDTGNLDKLDDTRTRKTIKLRPIASVAPTVKYSEVAAAPGGGEPVADPLSQRHTNTGAFAKLDDTRTRKTIKMAPGGGMKPEVDAPDAESKTIELKPVAPAVEPAAAPPEEVETATVPVTKAAPGKGGVPNLVPEDDGVPIVPGPAAAAPPPLKAAPAPAPLKAAAPRPLAPSPPPLKTAAPPPAAPAAAPAAPTASGPVDPNDTRTRKTIKITASKASSVLEATESVMPSVAQAKTIPAGETIRLRPSEGGSAPPPQPVLQSSAKDTIRLKPGGSGVAAPPPASPSAPTIAPPSASTVALKAPSSTPQKPPAPSAPLAAPSPGAAPGPKIGLKPQQTAPAVPPAASTPPSSTGGEKKGGLALKKSEDSGAPKGPPRAQKDQEIIKNVKKDRGPGKPSVFYTAMSVFTFLFLLFSTYVSAANYVNTWEQSRFEEPIHFPIPVLEDRINLR